MSGEGDFVLGYAMGHQVGQGFSNAIFGPRETWGQKYEARRADLQHELALHFIDRANKAREEAIAAKNETNNWRAYSNRLALHLKARKMSESALLEELKRANMRHPLATEPGFEQHFREELAKQYVDLDAADVDAYLNVRTSAMRHTMDIVPRDIGRYEVFGPEFPDRAAREAYRQKHGDAALHKVECDIEWRRLQDLFEADRDRRVQVVQDEAAAKIKSYVDPLEAAAAPGNAELTALREKEEVPDDTWRAFERRDYKQMLNDAFNKAGIFNPGWVKVILRQHDVIKKALEARDENVPKIEAERDGMIAKLREDFTRFMDDAKARLYQDITVGKLIELELAAATLVHKIELADRAELEGAVPEEIIKLTPPERMEALKKTPDAAWAAAVGVCHAKNKPLYDELVAVSAKYREESAAREGYQQAVAVARSGAADRG